MVICTGCGREFESATDTENLCPQCQAEILSTLPPDPEPGRLRRLLESPTIVLIALNTLVYLVMATESRNFTFTPQVLESWGANSGALTCSGQWWRLFTSTFEHGFLLHIALNMWALYNLGWLAELLFGRTRFTLMYLLCGIGGSLGSICWHGNGVSVGASGAIFGIAGALIPAMLLHGNQQLRKVLRGQLVSITIFVLYSLVSGARSSGIDNAAHIGGLVTGLILGALFPTGPDREEHRGRLRVAAGTGLMLLVFTGAGAFARQRNEPYVEEELALSAHGRGDISAAIVHARRAVQLNPQNAHAQFMLGTMLLDTQQYGDAVQPFTTTARLRPKFGPAFVNLCVAQRELKMLPEALSNCEHGAELAPGDSESWFNLGRVRYDLRDLTGARDALAKAAALNPQGFDENLQYALMLIANNQLPDAIPYLRKAHNLRPQDDSLTRLLLRAERQ